MNRMTIIRAALVGALAAAALACGGGGDGGGGVVYAVACGGAMAPAADRITLGCPAQATDSITVSVHLGGPTSSSDIFGLQFDLVFDPAVMQFEPPALEGSFLNRDGAATIMQVGAMQNDPGRLIVGIVRLGVPGGLQATAADEVVITLLFGRLSAVSTTLRFENAAAVDSSLQPIPQITFGTPLTITFD